MIDILIIFLGKYLGYILIAGFFVFWWETRKKHPRFLWESLAAAVLARGIITEAIRLFWERPRPFAENTVAPLIEHTASPSFPSGHAAFFFALGTILFLHSKKAGIVVLVGSAAMGIARVFAGLHWPSDILAGAVIGILSALFVSKLSKYKKR